MIAALIILCASAAASAQRPLVLPHYDTPDTTITEPIAALLNNGGQRVTMGAETLEFWWVKSLPLKSGTTDLSWTSVEPGMLVGAVQMSGQCADARGTAIKPGIYTLRYETEAGRTATAPARPVLFLLPAAGDSSTSAAARDSAESSSKQVSGSGHPAVLVLDTAVAAGDPRLIRRVGRQRSVVLSVPASRDGADAGLLPFALVIAGADKSDKE